MTPYIPVNLGRICRLRLSFGAIMDYEQLTGQMICRLNYTDERDMIVLLWAMLRAEEPGVTLEQTIRRLEGAEDKKSVFIAMHKAIAASAPPREKKEKQEYKPEFFDFGSNIQIAAEIGIPQRELWDMTPAEFHEAATAHIKNQKRKRNDLFRLAWYTAAFTRTKDKLPELKELLVDVNAPVMPKEQTPEQMLAALKVICAANGGNIVEV